MGKSLTTEKADEIIAAWGSEMYVPCPRCEGSCQVYAYTGIDEPFKLPRGEYFSCPLCAATGEADRDKATAWVRFDCEGIEDE